MFDLDAASAALTDALLSGCPAGTHLLWADQNVPRPALPYLSLHMGPIVSLAPNDIQHHEFDPDAPPGQEITYSLYGPREATFSVQAFTHATGRQPAYSLLRAALGRLQLSSVKGAIDLTGLFLVEVGAITNISALMDTTIESRAAADLRFRFVETAEDKVTYIETVDVTGETTL